MHCTITGAGGFIGRHLIPFLAARGHSTAGWGRASGWFDLAAPAADAVHTWTERLRGTDVVIHLAGRAHVQDGVPGEEAALHQRINRDGTLALARAAQAAGVRRFLYISSAKVLGEGGRYTADSPPRPEDAYARSKWEAEQGLHRLGGTMEVTIVRPPLVYGPGVGANFERLVKLARLPVPLPLAAVDNRRDLIGIDNLVDLIGICLDHPAAPGATLLCSDGKPCSLPELLGTIRDAIGRPRWLFRAPPTLIDAAARAVLGPATARRLFDDFEVDINATRTLLGWEPPHTMPAMLAWLRAEERA